MKTAFITGATSGLGAEFARRYAKEGYRLILTGRRTRRLCALKEELGTECLIITADVSDEANCKKLLEEIADEEIDVFINNAGFGTAGSFLETDLEKEISIVKVNDIAMHILFKGVLVKMQKQGHGTILNVASSAGLLPAGPYMATYYASKAYVTSLTKAVACELKEIGSSVYVACLCPGPVDTEFNMNADVSFSLKGITAEKCVDECLKGMRKKKAVIIPTLRMKVALYGSRFVTQSFVIKMTAGQQKKKTR
ncbi:SDR family NAD(P)-dependent oxidoreductase [Butyrivibrio hungatei]|uniref:SDR family NAD(P)-dependent oxidoreductase n=1 Tax=Butyrivibrio hungatei TaxID=185008 RepID=UPI000419D1F6|nr:SDR family oxidoreductase [Butyrivibrio hungatei]